MDKSKSLTEGQRAYEQKRAAKAGLSLDKWLAEKERQALREAPPPSKLKKPPGLLSRLVDRAHLPLKKAGSATKEGSVKKEAPSKKKGK